MVGFSAAAFLVRWAGLIIPIIGSEINIDPREIFVTLGAAFTGPVGGLAIGFFAGLSSATIVFGPSDIIAHFVGGLLIGFLYKPVHRRWRMPILLLGWVCLIAAYYYVFLIPTNIVTVLLTEPERLSTVFGANLSFSQLYILLASGAFFEAVGTLIITTIILIALPDKYRRPLW